MREIRKKFNFFSESHVHSYKKTYRAEGPYKTAFLLPDFQDIIWRLVSHKPKFYPPGGFRMTTASKGCRHRCIRFAITNNQHAPNIYSEDYLIKNNTCKIYG